MAIRTRPIAAEASNVTFEPPPRQEPRAAMQPFVRAQAREEHAPPHGSCGFEVGPSWYVVGGASIPRRGTRRSISTSMRKRDASIRIGLAFVAAPISSMRGRSSHASPGYTSGMGRPARPTGSPARARAAIPPQNRRIKAPAQHNREREAFGTPRATARSKRALHSRASARSSKSSRKSPPAATSMGSREGCLPGFVGSLQSMGRKHAVHTPAEGLGAGELEVREIPEQHIGLDARRSAVGSQRLSDLGGKEQAFAAGSQKKGATPQDIPEGDEPHAGPVNQKHAELTAQTRQQSIAHLAVGRK